MPSSPRAQHCPRCSSPLVEIAMVPGRSTVTMRSCSTCRSTSWFRDQMPVELRSALAAMSGRPAPAVPRRG